MRSGIFSELALLIAVLLPAPPAVAEGRIEGIVRHTVVTHCDARSCAGALALEGRMKTLTITVPLGTPVSRGCGAVPFHRLTGKTVIVTEVAERSGHVARAIEVVEQTAGDC